MVKKKNIKQKVSKSYIAKIMMISGFLAFLIIFFLPVKALTTNTPNFTTTSGYLAVKFLNNLSEPFNDPEKFNELTQTKLWQKVISPLWVNRDKDNLAFGSSDSKEWNKNTSTIPANIVGIQVSKDRTFALVYYAGIPDYEINTPPFFTNYKPINKYGILKLSISSTPNNNNVHELSSKGNVSIYVNGSGIFNYTDTFSYEDEGAWSFNANVAEVSIINSDGAHATPDGEFHNHLSSRLLLEELGDPFAKGDLSHSVQLGFAIDNNPVYGPLGYTTTNGSDKIKVLQSSYITRDWLKTENGGTGKRSSLPEWAVINWDGSNEKGDSILNLSGLDKTNLLYSDGNLDGTVKYNGDDVKLAAEIETLGKSYTLQEDALGYAYWTFKVSLPNGKTVLTRNYLLKSSKLWGPNFNDKILPAIYSPGTGDEFKFKADISSFAEDYVFVEGYGDLDFYNGIDSYIPELKTSQYHYVTTYSAKLGDEKRLEKSAFPYFLGIQYKSQVNKFNNQLDNTGKVEFFKTSRDQLETIYDLGIIGKDDNGNLIKGSVIKTWQEKLLGS